MWSEDSWLQEHAGATLSKGEGGGEAGGEGGVGFWVVYVSLF